MRRIIPVTVLLACFFGYVAVAQAASTKYSVYIKNSTNATKKIYLGSDLGGTQNLASGSNMKKSTTDTAYWCDEKKHTHNFDVKTDTGQSYCTVTIWLKNEVTFFGKTKLTDYGYSSSDNSKCEVKKGSSGSTYLDMEVTIK